MLIVNGLRGSGARRRLADAVRAYLDKIAVPVTAARQQARDLAAPDSQAELTGHVLDGTAAALRELQTFTMRAIRRERRVVNAVRILVCGAACASMLLGAHGLALLGAAVVTLLAMIGPAWRACTWWGVSVMNTERAELWRERVREVRTTNQAWPAPVRADRLESLLFLTVSDANMRTRSLISLLTRVLAADGAPRWAPEVHERLGNLSELLTLAAGFPQPAQQHADRTGAA